jgi:enoyl-[acyl-carrier protein] reductase/trans-2-enoyl-CoA reductase (NAD+)
MRKLTIDTIKADLGQVDLVIYSLASPVRKLPDTGEVVRSCLKPIGETFRSTAIDTTKEVIFDAEIEPATAEEIANTITVMGGQDWELWMQALQDAGVLADGVKTVSYSYIGSALTWPIYWHGALGKAKEDMDRAASDITKMLAPLHGSANVAVLKSVVTQASAAIPVMPLYISLSTKIMSGLGTHEGTLEQIDRMFRSQLYSVNGAELDDQNRIRMDDWELRDEVQNEVKAIWPTITTENLFELSNYAVYRAEFLKLFGFGVDGVDYEADVDTLVDFEPKEI